MINTIDTQDKRKIGYRMSPQIRISDKLYKHLKKMNGPMSKSLDRIVLGEAEDFTSEPKSKKPPYMFIYASIINCWIEYEELCIKRNMPQGNNLYNVVFPSADIKESIFEKIHNEDWFVTDTFDEDGRRLTRQRMREQNITNPVKKLSNSMHFFGMPFNRVLDNALGTMVKLGYMSREKSMPTERVVGVPYEYKVEQIPYEDLVKGIIANSQTALESTRRQNDGTFPKLADLFQ